MIPQIDDEAMGPSAAVPRLCTALAEMANRVELHVLEPSPAVGDTEVHTYRCLPGFRFLGVSPGMYRGLKQAGERTEVLHNHSLWKAPSFYAGRIAKRGDCPLVTSPRGTLSTRAIKAHGRFGVLSPVLKRLTWSAGQRNAVEEADCLHVTTELELRQIRDQGIGVPAAVVPNGVTIPPPRPPEVRPADCRRLLFLGRLNRIKGIDLLLEAWARLEDEHPRWHLDLVGPDNSGYVREILRLIDALGVDRAHVHGPVYGREKTQAYWRSDLFVLTSYSESFAMTVAESLAHGVPVLVSNQVPWPEVEAKGCGWSVSLTVEEIAAGLDAALSLDRETLVQRGARGREWMREEYSWAKIAQQMHETYRWVTGDRERPPWVYTSP